MKPVPKILLFIFGLLIALFLFAILSGTKDVQSVIVAARKNADRSSAAALLLNIKQQLILAEFDQMKTIVINDNKIDNSSIYVNFDFDADLTLTLSESTGESMINGTIEIRESKFTVENSKLVE